MKSLKTQSTSYKDFLDKIGKAKQLKIQIQLKHKNIPKSNINSCTSLHTQPNCRWVKCSPIQNRLIIETSAQKKQKYHNQSMQSQSKRKTISRKDMMLCYKKFVTQATNIMTQTFKVPPQDLLSNPISYIEYLEALKSFKMIYDNYEPYPNDLVSELWSQFVSKHNVRNFFIILSAILGLYENQQTQQDKYIKNKYQVLRFTRMQLQKCQNKVNLKQNQYTFMPQISDRSRKLASSRSKAKRQNKHILHNISTDRVLTDRTQKSVIYYDKSKTCMEEYDQNVLYENYTQNYNNLKPDFSGNRRSQILYQLAKQKSLEKRINKSSNQIQYEKSKSQLTFKPKILKNIKVKNKQNISSSKNLVRGEKNTVNRMIKGRVQRQVRKIINQKGVPYNQKLVQKMKKQKYYQIIANMSTAQFGEQSNCYQNYTQETQINTNLPTQQVSQCSIKSNYPPVPYQDLVIDVYISQHQKQKLVICKGQCLQQVASRFIQAHGLPFQKKQQLIQLLQISVNHALCRIDQLVQQQQLASARTYYKKQYIR